MIDNRATESDNHKTSAENAINRKLDALKGAVVMLAASSPYISEAAVVLEDLDEVWDEG